MTAVDEDSWKKLVIAANDNCNDLSISRAEAMAHVRAVIRAVRVEFKRSTKKPLVASMEALARAEAWVKDPIGIMRQGNVPPGYEVVAGERLTRWRTPDGFEATTSTPAIGAIKCWQHWEAAQVRKFEGS